MIKKLSVTIHVEMCKMEFQKHDSSQGEIVDSAM